MWAGSAGRCLITEHLKQRLSGREHLSHAEFALLTAMLVASSHMEEERLEASQLLDNRTMALDSLPRRHSSDPASPITASAALAASADASG